MVSVITITPSAAKESIGSGFGGDLDYQINLSEASTDVITFSYRILPGTATIGRDVPIQSGTVTLAPGETTQTLTFRASSDNIDETDEAFVLEFFNPVGGGI